MSTADPAPLFFEVQAILMILFTLAAELAN